MFLLYSNLLFNKKKIARISSCKEFEFTGGKADRNLLMNIVFCKCLADKLFISILPYEVCIAKERISQIARLLPAEADKSAV